MISGELEFWRDVALNLLTDEQLDSKMPHSGLTSREVLSKVRRDEQVMKDFGRCPYCSRNPTSSYDYCYIHKPIRVRTL